MPWMMPPRYWLRAVLALRMRPAANALTMRCTRTTGMSWSTLTSTKCAPNACDEYVSSACSGFASNRASISFM